MQPDRRLLIVGLLLIAIFLGFFIVPRGDIPVALEMLAEGQYRQAADRFEQIHAADPEDKELQLQYVKALLLAGEVDYASHLITARSYLNLDYNEDNLDLVWEIYELCSELGLWDAAIVASDQLRLFNEISYQEYNRLLGECIIDNYPQVHSLRTIKDRTDYVAHLAYWATEIERIGYPQIFGSSSLFGEARDSFAGLFRSQLESALAWLTDPRTMPRLEPEYRDFARELAATAEAKLVLYDWFHAGELPSELSEQTVRHLLLAINQVPPEALPLEALLAMHPDNPELQQVFAQMHGDDEKYRPVWRTEVIKSFEFTHGEISFLEFSDDGRWLLIGSEQNRYLYTPEGEELSLGGRQLVRHIEGGYILSAGDEIIMLTDPGEEIILPPEMPLGDLIWIDEEQFILGYPDHPDSTKFLLLDREGNVEDLSRREYLNLRAESLVPGRQVRTVGTKLYFYSDDKELLTSAGPILNYAAGQDKLLLEKTSIEGRGFALIDGEGSRDLPLPEFSWAGWFGEAQLFGTELLGGGRFVHHLDNGRTDYIQFPGDGFVTWSSEGALAWWQGSTVFIGRLAKLEDQTKNREG
ncbi:MAG: tetratricopeptide repeat protein [Firmicutes bacterium]|nr:tetratricopeptide repeat protein [Bacillota bacterium]